MFILPMLNHQPCMNFKKTYFWQFCSVAGESASLALLPPPTYRAVSQCITTTSLINFVYFANNAEDCLKVSEKLVVVLHADQIRTWEQFLDTAGCFIILICCGLIRMLQQHPKVQAGAAASRTRRHCFKASLSKEKLNKRWNRWTYTTEEQTEMTKDLTRVPPTLFFNIYFCTPTKSLKYPQQAYPEVAAHYIYLHFVQSLNRRETEEDTVKNSTLNKKWKVKTQKLKSPGPVFIKLFRIYFKVC